MNRSTGIAKNLLAIAISSVLLSTAANAESVITHQDHRQSAKLIFQPVFAGNLYSSEPALARAYLSANASRFALPKNLNNLQLAKVQESLSARHYYFQQMFNGLPVHSGEVIVSMDKKSGTISRVFNNSFPVKDGVSNKHAAALNNAQALSKAWDHLQAVGALKAEPKAELVYRAIGDRLVLSFRTQIVSTQPAGDWQHWIDAKTGAVLEVSRLDLPNRKNANHDAEGVAKKWAAAPANKQHQDFAVALANWQQKQASKTALQTANQFKALADGTAQVFDPDPRTSLNSEALTDASSAASFDAAYFSRTLKDIDLTAGVYRLNGPWVSIQDLSAPNTAPSTSATGNWAAQRGNNAFNDAMTYFHIDQSQRYMQGLGFTGPKGIQAGPIAVDTDGADGADQSFFSPSGNSLEFGHGGVDDNEDADVILHEYGHAIQHSINNNWDGGDTGSMGEGFGDYWAGSYSYSTPNGQSFHPEWVFSWDGHNSFWDGRVMDATSRQYDPALTYTAHGFGGTDGDELWSTPLFQSLVALVAAGTPRSEVDKIVLESHFGLGSGMKMPDMARATVQAAQTLFPAGQHASVFSEKFKQVKILGASISAGTLAITETDGDGVAEPGETVTLNVPLNNTGVNSLSGVSAVLSTAESGVTVSAANSAYDNIPAGQAKTNTTPFGLAIAGSHACGDDISLQLATSFTDGSSADTANLSVLLPVGTRATATASASPALAIPDNNPTGVSSTLTHTGSGVIINSANGGFSVDVNISHSYRGDLKLTLRSPAGTNVQLTAAGEDPVANIIGNFPLTLTPVGSLAALDGQSLDGIWQLTVVDAGASDIGTLNSWAVNAKGAATCNGSPANTPPVAVVTNASITANESTAVNMNASGSTDADGDTLSYAWTQTSGPTVTLTGANTASASFTAPSVSANTSLSFLVTVSDGKGGSDNKTVTVTVNNYDSGGGGGYGGGGGGGSFAPWLLLLAGLAGWRRHRSH